MLSSGNDAPGEDIRSKLARYKKEREDFELVRQQFRQKNNELSKSSKPYTENTPVGGQYANLSNNGSGSQKRLNTGGNNNIFAVDGSANQNKDVQAFTAHMASGSPAFGQPEPSNQNSRDQV